MSSLKTKEEIKEKTIEQEHANAQSESDYSMKFDFTDKTQPLATQSDSQKNQRVDEASRKYGFDIDNSTGNYKEIMDIEISDLNEEELSEVESKTKAIKDSLFSTSLDEVEFTSKLTRFNMNLSSQVGDNYNNLSKEIASKTKMNNADEIAKEINELNNVIQNSGLTLNSKNPVVLLTNFFRKAKRNVEIERETIEDKIQTINQELISKREEQSQLLIDNDKKVRDLLGFIKEVNKTLSVCREVIVEVEKKRIEIAEKARKSGSSSPMLISYYKDIYSQEKSLENLIRNLLAVRLHLNTSFNKNSDMRGTYQSIANTINEVITFVVPSYRHLLVDHITQNKIEETLGLIDLVKKARDRIESESHNNYQNIRLSANKLANESIYNIKTLADSVAIIVDTERKIREQDQKAKQASNEDIKAINSLQKEINEYCLGKNEVKR